MQSKKSSPYIAPASPADCPRSFIYISPMAKNALPQTEDLTVEFKSSFDNDVIESLVAFSNVEGGSVYLGITDDGKVKGISINKETIATWINEKTYKNGNILLKQFVKLC